MISDNQAMEPTSGERGRKMRVSARTAAAQAAGQKLAKVLHVAGNVLELEVLAVNLLREAGQHLNVASGREQLLFTDAGLEFFRKEIAPHLPQGAELKHAQLAVHLAKVLPKPVTTAEELRAVKAEVRQLELVLGISPAPARKELQAAHTRNLFSECVNKFCIVGALLDEIEQEDPMSKWPRDELDRFLRTVRPVKERIDMAERLLLGTVEV